MTFSPLPESFEQALAEVKASREQYKIDHRKIDTLRAALENCRLLAARHRHEEWAQHILRFCLDAGVFATPSRDAAITKGESNG